MNQKTVVIAIGIDGRLECYGSYKKLCLAKGVSYQTMLNNKKTPKLGRPITIEGYIIHKVECK